MSRIPSIAVIGAGTAGLYIADQLMCQTQPLHVDLIDTAPSPAGIARFAGSASSAAKAKSTTNFIGNVTVGTHITILELQKIYDVVIDTTSITNTEFAANAALGLALHQLHTSTAENVLSIGLADFLIARGVPATRWTNPLNLPAGHSFAQWAQVFRAAHGTPVCI